MNYYEILELSKTASQNEVKAAYKKMATVVHPDKGGSAMLFRLVQEAYEVLSDPVKRKQHDSDLSGPSGGNREAGSQKNQQKQDDANQSEPNYIRIEELYKRWKDNRNRIAMPKSESSAAGGVRQMIRESALTIVTSDCTPKVVLGMKIGDELNMKIGDHATVKCGNCGFEAIHGSIKRLNPLSIEHHPSPGLESLGTINEGGLVSRCQRCNLSAGALKVIRLSMDQFFAEKIEIRIGDFLLFECGPVIDRIKFGVVIEGEVKNDLGIKSLRVIDEFSGNVLSLKDRTVIKGHWKSNDLSKNRTGSMRNWSF